MLKRRNFVTTLSATVLVATLPVGAAAAIQSYGGKASSLRKRFRGLVDTDFRLFDAVGVARKARLVAVDDGPKCPGLEQFSIVFEGEELGEGLYQIRSWRTGRILVNLQSSGGPGMARNRQRACFSNFV